MKREEVEALKQEDMTDELIQRLELDSVVVHHAMEKHRKDGWTLKQSLIEAIAWLTIPPMR